MSNDTPRHDYIIHLRPIDTVDAMRAVRRMLKYSLRVCGLKCVSVQEAE